MRQWGTQLPKEEREDAEAGGAEKSSTPASDAARRPAPMLVSGGAKGEDVLEGRPAIVDIPAGKGHLVAFNFNPMHRDLNRSDYRLLWNAIINWKAILGPLGKSLTLER